MATAAGPRIAGRVAFTYPDFIRYELARFFIVLALEMQSVAVGWQVYDITKRPLDLGLIGLAQFLPGIVLFLPAGHAADRFDRRNLLTICYLGFALASGLLLATAWLQGRSVHAIYAIVVFLGIVRTFNWPVSRALLPQLVAEEHFPKCSGVELEHISGCDDSGAGGRWGHIRILSRSRDSVRKRDAGCLCCNVLHIANLSQAQAAGSGASCMGHGAGWVPICLAAEGCAGLDFAGHVCSF